MAKRLSVREHLMQLKMENKQQTDSINEIKDIMKEHVQSSQKFREKCTKNSVHIFWIKVIGGALFGSLITLLGIILYH